MCIRDRRRVHGEYISSLLSTSTSTRKKRETRMSGGEDLVQIQKKIEEMTAKVEEKDKLLMEIAHKLSDVHNQYQQALENKEAMIKDMHTLRTKLESKDNQLRQELKDKDVIVQKLQSLEKENEKLKKQVLLYPYQRNNPYYCLDAVRLRLRVCQLEATVEELLL
eukprot:TRINITY_DN4495_c0_g2_i3.p1 TRINITY_DN4495_c0_g2~~TRINITY_DN4495_c0_g2_i3.p1  ORF type:complete len:165 (+),score=51.89 TRINITY_DN4495_c0_g2_i3:64-558(+)